MRKRKLFADPNKKQLCIVCDTYLPQTDFLYCYKINKTCCNCIDSGSKYGKGTKPFRDQLEGERDETYKAAKERAIYNGLAKDDYQNPWLSYTGWKNESDFRKDSMNNLRHEKAAEFNTYKIPNKSYIE